MNQLDPGGQFPCLSLHCIASDVGVLAGAVSAVTGVIAIAIPAFAAISEAAAGVAVIADITACSTGSCNYAVLALDVVALIPGAAAVHFTSAAAETEAELEAAELLGKVDPSLKNNKGFQDLVSNLSGIKATELSGASLAISAGEGRGDGQSSTC